MNKQTLPATAHFNREQYEAIEALSFTGLKELLKSPAHYQQWKATPSEETKALIIGKAVHLAVLKNADFLIGNQEVGGTCLVSMTESLFYHVF